jgi:hypothetical protein
MLALRIEQKGKKSQFEFVVELRFLNLSTSI